MIKIEDLRDEDVGREVRYTTGHGDIEFGRITKMREAKLRARLRRIEL